MEGKHIMQKEQEQNYTEKVNKINAGKNLKYSIYLDLDYIL